MIIGQAIIRDGLFLGGLGLRQLATVEKNARAVFIGVRHTGGLERNQEVCYRANLTMAQTNCKRCGREYIYHCCDGPVCMPCPHCGFDESDPEPLSALSNQPQNIPNSARFELVAALRCVSSKFDLNFVFLVQSKPCTK